MDTQQGAFQVKMSPVFLKKPWKLKRGAPYVSIFQSVETPQIHSPLLCYQHSTQSTIQLLFCAPQSQHCKCSLCKLPVMEDWIQKKNLKYQGLHVTKKKKKTARHRQVSQSRTLLKQKRSIF